jgi:hypothetical protein
MDLVLTLSKQGCQMVYFQTKNLNLGVFLMGLSMENVGTFRIDLEYFEAMWNILGLFANFVFIW